MGESRPAKRILAFAAAALLSGVAAPRVQAQDNIPWLEVGGPTTLTLRNGETVSYRIRLKKKPILMDRDGNRVLDEMGDEQEVTRADSWWVRVRVDGSVRYDGYYDVDGDTSTGLQLGDLHLLSGDEEYVGADITWRPSIGREFWKDNWDNWVDIRITAHSDINAPVVFSHEVWSNDTWCPEHGVGPVTVSPSSIPVTIVDNYGPPTGIDLTVFPNLVGEDEGEQSLRVTATLTGGGTLTTPTDVTLSVVGITATVDDDYTYTFPPTLTIPANSEDGTEVFFLTPVDNDQDEPDKTLEVRGTSLPVLPVDPAMITIDDDEDDEGSGGGGGGGGGTRSSDPELRPQNARASEDSGQMVFTVEISDVSSSPVSVRWKTADGTAESGDDYVAERGTLTIPARERSGTIRVRLLDDRIHEPRETFAIRFSAPEGATLGNDEAIGTIFDDDSVPGLAVEDASAEEGAREILFTAELSNGSASPVSVEWETVDGTAESGDDYATATGTLTIAAGDQSATIRVEIEDDRLHEPEETFAIRFSAPEGATLADDEAVGTIVDDDPVPELAVEDASAEEGAREILFTAELSNGSASPVSVDWETADGTAKSTTDYAEAARTLIIPAGQTSGTIAIRVDDDSLHEPDETFAIRFSAPSGVTLRDDEAIGTIVDDDSVPELAVEDASAEEGAREILFTANLSNGSGTPVSVEWETVDGTAESGDDYTGATGTLTVAAGAQSATVSIEVQDDRLHERDETFAIRFSAPSGVTLGDDEAIGTILDDDPVPELRVRDANASENAREVVFAAKLSAPSALPVTVRWRTSDDGASAGADYTASEGVLSIPAGRRDARVAVPLLDDRLDEPDETFTVELSEPTGVTLANTRAVGTILDDDAEPALLIGDATAVEGEGRLGFFVWLASDSGRTVTVDYATREGSATAEADYRPATGTLDIPPGSEGETIWVAVVDDRLHENPETLELVLADPEFAVPGDLVATGTIKDDDAEPGLRIADVSASERAGGMVFVATMEAVAGRTLSWDFQTWDGSAVAGEDYERRTGTLMFEAGEIRKTIPVTIVDDTMDEVEEDFRVILRNPRDSGLAVPEPTGLILDDDDNAVVADAWASRFGRTVAIQVVNAVAGRFAGMGGPGSHFLFGLDPYSTFGLAGARGNQRWENQWRETSSGGSESVRLGLDPGRILSGTSFVYQTEEDEPSDGGLDGRWTAWGRGSFLQFDGLDPGVGVSGEVFNITTGFDYETGPLIAGLALAGSVGTGDYHVARTGIQSERMGKIWSLLGSAHPYVHVALAEWLRVWGLGGIGSGTLRISGSEQDTDLGMRMWAFGGRSDLRVPGLGGLRFALKSDMFWVEMESDATDTRRGSTAEARRLRLMLESSFRVISFWGGEFSPLLEAGVRDDAGDAETGRGLEVASGFRFQNRDRGFFVEATARTLVSHQDETYREWGIGGTLRLDPGPDYLGLAIQINSSQGAAASSVQRMWSDPGAVTYFPGMAQGRHEAEVGYGFRALRGGAMVIPFSGFAYSPSGANSFRVGSRVRLGSRWMLSLQADRNRYGFRDPWYGLVLRGHLLPERWMRPAPAGESR